MARVNGSLLAVVQHDQAVGFTEGVSERVRRRAAGVADAEGRRDLPEEERPFGDRSELDPGGAIAEVIARMTSAARRVFPLPPAPVSVTSRPVASRSHTTAISRSRPTKDVSDSAIRGGLEADWTAGITANFIRSFNLCQATGRPEIVRVCDGSCP